MKNLTPLKYNVLVFKPDTSEDIVIQGGIYIPNKATENHKMVHGVIQEVGNLAESEYGFKVGMDVFFDKWSTASQQLNPTIVDCRNIILIEV